MGGFYEVHHWDGLRCHDIHTKFHKDWFRHSKVYMGGYTDTEVAWWCHRGLRIFFQNKESRLQNSSFLSLLRKQCEYPEIHLRD
jgi:hypothetical protein